MRVTRLSFLEDVSRGVNVDAGVERLRRQHWHDSREAYRKVAGLDGADGNEITADEARRLVGEQGGDVDRFAWTGKDLASGAVKIT